MNPEHVKVTINNALDLLQIINEDLEENFLSAGVNNDVKARATMTISALYILSDYLREVKEHG